MIKYMWKIACTGLLLFGLWLSSCKNEDFNIGGYLVDPHTRVIMIDTITIKVSNMAAADSVVTSNKGIGFSGIYTDPQIGTTQTQTYMEFSRTTDSETDKYAKFDSVTLLLRPNGNYYGDTVKRAAFKVSKLVNKIEKRDDGYLYSSSSFPVGTQLVDTTQRIRSKVPKDQNGKFLLGKIFEVRLPNSFGEWLFQGILRNEDAFNENNYLKTFPGLSLSAGTGSDCVHGLAITDSTCMIRIYYHVNTSFREEKTMTFRVNQLNSFYNINNDKSELPPYNTKSDPVPSSKTENKGIIISGGTPLYTRLEFPYLNELLALGEIVKIYQATLYIRPIQHSYDTVPLPPKLNIYYFDPTSNTPLSSAIKPPSSSGSSSSTAVQNGMLPENYQYLQKPDIPEYRFDVTDFISSQLGKEGYNKWALSLLIPDDARETTLQRLVFGNQKYWYRSENQSKDNQIKLEVKYVVYNSIN